MFRMVLLAVLLGTSGGAVAGACERWSRFDSAPVVDLSSYNARVTVRLESAWESLRLRGAWREASDRR